MPGVCGLDADLANFAEFLFAVPRAIFNPLYCKDFLLAQDLLLSLFRTTTQE